MAFTILAAVYDSFPYLLRHSFKILEIKDQLCCRLLNSDVGIPSELGRAVWSSFQSGMLKLKNQVLLFKMYDN